MKLLAIILILLSLTLNASQTASVTTLIAVYLQHKVTLSWVAPICSSNCDPNVASYNVYISLVSGGPYTYLANVPVTTTTYIDSTEPSGITRYYVVSSVGSSGDESVYSNEATAIIPIP